MRNVIVVAYIIAAIAFVMAITTYIDRVVQQNYNRHNQPAVVHDTIYLERK